jgi:hypothetical protein
MAPSSADHSMIYRVAGLRGFSASNAALVKRADSSGNVYSIPGGGMMLVPPPGESLCGCFPDRNSCRRLAKLNWPVCLPRFRPSSAPPTFRLIYFRKFLLQYVTSVNLTPSVPRADCIISQVCMGRTDVEASSCAARIKPTTRAITKQYWVVMSERFRMKVGHFFIFAEL